MFQVRCIEKFRDANNNIIGYRLQDMNGSIKDVKPYELKQAIFSKKLYVINLKLTSNHRLIDVDESKVKDSEKNGVKLGNVTTKSKLINKYINIRDVFSNIEYHDGNINKLELNMTGFNKDTFEIILDFNYDYSCDKCISTQKLLDELRNSIYKDIITINNPWINYEEIKINNSFREDAGAFTVKLSEGQFWELMHNTVEFFNTKKLVESDIARVSCDSRRTNIGVVNCYSVDIVVDGHIAIPVITAAREGFVFSEAASDSKIYYKKILPFVKQFR